MEIQQMDGNGGRGIVDKMRADASRCHGVMGCADAKLG